MNASPAVFASAAPDQALKPRERILQAAARLFYSHGFHSTGIDRIIAEAGVAKMSLYQHFHSKDELINAFLARRDDYWCDWLAGRVEALASAPRTRLPAVFDALGEWFASEEFRGCAFINAAAEFSDARHAARIASREHKDRVTAYLKGLAEAAKMNRPAELAGQLALLIEGAIVTAQVYAQAAEAHDTARDARGPAQDTAARAKAMARRVIADFQPA